MCLGVSWQNRRQAAFNVLGIQEREKKSGKMCWLVGIGLIFLLGFYLFVKFYNFFALARKFKLLLFKDRLKLYLDF